MKKVLVLFTFLFLFGCEKKELNVFTIYFNDGHVTEFSAMYWQRYDEDGVFFFTDSGETIYFSNVKEVKNDATKENN